jgi:O-antigen/teichoic acid export membrane protein
LTDLYTSTVLDPPNDRQGLAHTLAGMPVARNTASMLLGLGSRTAVQLVYFVLVARSLGAEQYGYFAGCVALALILGPYTSLGAGNLLVRAAARRPGALPGYWYSGLVSILALGGSLSVLGAFAWDSLVGKPGFLRTALCILLADLVFTRFVELAAQSFQSVSRLHYTALIQLSLTLARLLAAVAALTLVDAGTARDWAGLYLAATALSALFAIVLTTTLLDLGRPQRQMALLVWRERKEGLLFSLSLSAQSIHNDADKALLLQLASPATAGAYSAAYKLVDAAFIPLRSLFAATYADFFRRGEAGLGPSRRLGLRLLPVVASYGLFAAVVLVLGRPVLPRVLGSEYAEVSAILLWLCALPLLRGMQYLVGNVLTGADLLAQRTAVQLVVTVLNVGLNVVLIPLYGWRGAAFASLLCDGVLALGLIVAAWATARPRLSALPGYHR